MTSQLTESDDGYSVLERWKMPLPSTSSLPLWPLGGAGGGVAGGEAKIHATMSSSSLQRCRGWERVVQRLAGTIMWSRASAAATTVAEPVVEGRPLELAKDGAVAGPVLAVSPCEAGSSGSRAHGAASADVTAVAKSAGKVRHSGIAKHSVRESDIAVPSGEAGPSWSRASGSANTAEMAADAKSVGVARPGTIWLVGGPKISRRENVEGVNERVREEIMRCLDEKRVSFTSP